RPRLAGSRRHGDGRRLRPGLAECRGGEPAHRLRARARHGHPLRRLPRRDPPDRDRRPAGPAPEVRGADPLGRPRRRGAALDELGRVAERLGAPVISESGTTHGRLAFRPDHPLYARGLPLWSPEVRERLAGFDVILAVGLDLLRQYVYYEPSRAIPETVRLVHL